MDAKICDMCVDTTYKYFVIFFVRCGIIVHLQGRAAEKREKEIQNASHIINKTIQICFSSFVHKSGKSVYHL